MAVIKHISIKNASYNATIDYLTTQHDEFTNKPILDEQGHRIPRIEFLLDGINCDPESFHQECQELNARYNQKQARADIKAHHYILSFDPRDRDENGLTPEQTQQLTIAFAKKNFPGHQTIVCTHPAGHNSAGNIHTHIVINSVRALDVEIQDFMERPADSLASKKHHVTKDFLKYLKLETMNLCQQEEFYQVDLLSPAKIRITDCEYWVQRKGQHALNQSNAEQLSNGVIPTQTIFETDKGYPRRVISTTLSDCRSYEEFQKKLYKQYGIEVHERRKKLHFSYLIIENLFVASYLEQTLKELSDGNPIPSLKSLREERDQLIATSNTQYETYSFARSKLYELKAIHQNPSTYIKEKDYERIRNNHKNFLNVT